MAYSELMKNFERIRAYMREFYVYGFRSREEIGRKSARSYDNERRRIESWLGDYMGFRQSENGKNVFLSIDSRSTDRNPLYQAWKAKSFTDGDITLHFILLDILYSPQVCLTVHEIADRIDREYLSCFEDPVFFDESTVRKKLKEYEALGILESEKDGRRLVYRRRASEDTASEDTASEDTAPLQEGIQFFSEISPCGVIGSYLLDRQKGGGLSYFFKHHYITHALESEILCLLFEAMTQRRSVSIRNFSQRSGMEKVWDVTPLRIRSSVQSGRQYLMAYCREVNSIRSYRLDYITGVTMGDEASDFEELRQELAEIEKHMWGVTYSKRRGTEHVEFTVHIGEKEEYIYHRLQREKRCGTVERLGENTCRFSADVYDTYEMIPWIRTFICRITSFHFSNRSAENQFRRDLSEMYRLYDVKLTEEEMAKASREADFVREGSCADKNGMQ